MSDECAESFVELFERARHAERLAFLSESQMTKLLRWVALPVAMASPLVGELVLRKWLCSAGASEFEPAAFERFVSPALRAAFDVTATHAEPHANADLEHARDRAAWEFFVRRARRFLAADGVIALLVGRRGNEAVALPFRLLPHLPRDTRARSLGDESIAAWCNEIRALEQECGEDFGFVVDAELPVSIEGGSFALAVVLARARARGEVAPFHPLKVIATGAFRGGRLETVEGVRAKAALAKRMGAIFVAPSVGTIALAPGLTPHEAVGAFGAELVARGFATPSPSQAYNALLALEGEVHDGRATLGDAERRLDRCTAIFDSEPSSPFAAEARLRGCVLRAAIANHAGDPARARAEVEQALAIAARNPCIYAKAVANKVVTLTDLGFITEAERTGRELLAWVKDEMAGDVREKLGCEMVASGALGGQSLLQGALRGESSASESRELLTRALALATELGEGREISRAAVQIVLWHALLESESIEHAFFKAEEILGHRSPADGAVSRAYLLRARFLGAYRRLLSQGEITSGFEKWPLPDQSVAHLSWVHATARKYRGALYAAAGANELARADFMIATTLLGHESPPLLRLIGGTAALQAAESLIQAGAGNAAHWVDEALEVFREFRNPPGPALNGEMWEQRGNGLRAGIAPSSLPNPQRVFAY